MVLEKHIITYREDGTILSAGTLTSEEEGLVSSINNCPPSDNETGILIITREELEQVKDIESYIIDIGKVRLRSMVERRIRYEELYKRTLAGELTHLQGDPNSILVRWKDDFLPREYHRSV